MKKIIFILLFLVPSITHAQDRVNNTQQYSVISISKELKKAKFWIFNGSEWHSIKNNNPTASYGWNNKNFISLYTSKITVGNEIYYTITRTYWNGSLKYPQLNYGWENIKYIEDFLITSAQYRKLMELSDKEVFKLETDIYSDNMWKKGDKVNVYGLLLSMKNEYKKMKLVFMAKRTKSQNEDVIRFQFHPNPKLEAYESKWIYPDDITDNYFEVKTNDFYNILVSI